MSPKKSIEISFVTTRSRGFSVFVHTYKNQNIIFLKGTKLCLRPNSNKFIGVWVVPNQKQKWKLTQKNDYCNVVSDFWLEDSSAILQLFLPAAIYSQFTHYCHLGTSGGRTGENFDAHPRRPAALAAELSLNLQEKDCNSIQQKSQCKP